MSLITVYSQPGCGPCFGVKAHLRKAGVAFTERNIRKDPEAAAELAALGYQGTPVVVAGDMHTYGYRRDWLDKVVDAIRAEDPDLHVDSMLATIEQETA